MICFDEASVKKLFISPYVCIRCNSGVIVFYQRLTNKSFVIPGNESELNEFLKRFRDGLEFREAIINVGEIFNSYDGTEIVEGMIKIGVIE